MADYNTYEKRLRDGCRGRLEWLAGEFNTIRTGRANPAILDGVMVESYGSHVALKQIASVSVPEPRQLHVKPFDKANVPAVVMAINKSNIGVNPIADGDKVRIPIPSPTEESRKAMAKKIKEFAEQAKGQCRNVRHDVMKALKADAELTDEDMKRSYNERLEKTFKQQTDQIDELLKAKEKEIATV